MKNRIQEQVGTVAHLVDEVVEEVRIVGHNVVDHVFNGLQHVVGLRPEEPHGALAHDPVEIDLTDDQGSSERSIRKDYEAYVNGEEDSFYAVFVMPPEKGISISEDEGAAHHQDGHTKFLGYSQLLAETLLVVRPDSDNLIADSIVSTIDGSVKLNKTEARLPGGHVHTITYTSEAPYVPGTQATE